MKGYAFVTLGFCMTVTSCGAVQITEIMYNPDGADTKREWIEIFNDSEISIDISNFGLLENKVNHGISYYKGSAELGPGEYAVIAGNAENFAKEYSMVENVYDSVFTLNNTGEKISLIDELDNSVSSISYQSTWGAADDGNTLNLVDSNWIPRKPSPGSSVSSDSFKIEGGINKRNKNQMQPFISGQPVDNSSQVKIPKYAISEQSFDLEFNSTNDKRYRCEWYMGNGEFIQGCKISYLYPLPGKYEINFVATFRSKEVVNVSELIEVQPPKIELSTGKYLGDRYIRLSNHNKVSLDLSNWSVLWGQQLYNLPDHLLIGPSGDHVFTVDSVKVEYPVTILNNRDKVVLSVNDPNNKDDFRSNKSVDSTSNLTINSGLASKENDADKTNVVIPSPEVNLDINNEDYETKQLKLRRNFESYQYFSPSTGSVENTKVDHEVGINPQSLTSTAGNVRSKQFINHMSAIVLGGLVVLMFVGPKINSRQPLVKKSAKNNQDDNIQANEFEIIEIDDDEDF